MDFDLAWLLWGLPITFVLGWIASRFDLRQLQIEERQRVSSPLYKDVRAALLCTSPTWHELGRLTTLLGATSKQLYDVLLKLERDVLTGEDKELLEFRTKISDYILQYQSLEPFSRVPDRVRPHLQKLQASLPASDQLLEGLTAEIEDLAEINRKEKVIERRRAFQAYVIGLVGIVLAIVAFLFPGFGPGLVTLLVR